MAAAGIRVDVRADTKALTRTLNEQQRKIIPRVQIRAINEVAKSHRNVGTKAVAKDIRVPLKRVKFRYRITGEAKGERVEFKKAYRGHAEAVLSVYMRGIPAIQLVSAAQRVRSITGKAKKGVKAAGGRTYRRGFVAEGPSGSGNVQLFARITNKRNPIGVIKVGVRKRLTRAYNDEVKRHGPAKFRRSFNRLMQFELAKIKGD